MPFTPVTGPRLLVAIGLDAGDVKPALAGGLEAVTDKLGVSSAHVTFARADDVEVLRTAGFLVRDDQQFHFFNEGYGSYEDFLDTLASRKRKALKKERREALSAGITDRLADRHATSPSAPGTISSPSTWTPAAANGAGPTSTGNSSR